MNHLPNQQEHQHAEPSFCTPFPWTIASHPDTEGGYVIREAHHEQQTWCDQGYDISIEEGDCRSLLVARHEAGNIRLLQAAPDLFVALRDLVTSNGTVTAARTMLEHIFPDWQQLEIHDSQGERP
ncbi:hypothetical protein [Desulfobulbus oligotrophicus]|uniref:Uncharacterized protein n=1 Tax=Desulfobulbus oligotrophicus TaxID=1909699 RepID=A0A7T5VBB7_9BACT|nr:hypothetical protein [Desulfobulbus oligotrophicus]QQG64629.1 hypothetical protein HP555_01510 [Desulfobulbus oligotrophicus]